MNERTHERTHERTLERQIIDKANRQPLRLASGLKQPPPRPFKEGSELTCVHGRYAPSCRRCRLEK